MTERTTGQLLDAYYLLCDAETVLDLACRGLRIYLPGPLMRARLIAVRNTLAEALSAVGRIQAAGVDLGVEREIEVPIPRLVMGKRRRRELRGALADVVRLQQRISAELERRGATRNGPRSGWFAPDPDGSHSLRGHDKRVRTSRNDPARVTAAG
jgi:hypothetical protein